MLSRVKSYFTSDMGGAQQRRALIDELERKRAERAHPPSTPALSIESMSPTELRRLADEFVRFAPAIVRCAIKRADMLEKLSRGSR